MKNNNIRRLTLSGIYMAAAVICVIGACIVPGLDMTLLAVASAVTVFAVIESGIRYGILLYAGASLLGFFLSPNKITALMYVFFFGVYAIVKYFAEKPVKPAVQITIKCVYFLAVLLGAYFLAFTAVFGDISLPAWCPRAVVIPICMVVFILYDYVLTLAINIYNRRVHNRLNRS